MQPKNSDSALERVIERCVFENQWKRHPMKRKYAPLHENLVSQLESTMTCNGSEEFGMYRSLRERVLSR